MLFIQYRSLAIVLLLLSFHFELISSVKWITVQNYGSSSCDSASFASYAAYPVDYCIESLKSSTTGDIYSMKYRCSIDGSSVVVSIDEYYADPYCRGGMIQSNITDSLSTKCNSKTIFNCVKTIPANWQNWTGYATWNYNVTQVIGCGSNEVLSINAVSPDCIATGTKTSQQYSVQYNNIVLKEYTNSECMNAATHQEVYYYNLDRCVVNMTHVLTPAVTRNDAHLLSTSSTDLEYSYGATSLSDIEGVSYLFGDDTSAQSNQSTKGKFTLTEVAGLAIGLAFAFILFVCGFFYFKSSHREHKGDDATTHNIVYDATASSNGVFTSKNDTTVIAATNNPISRESEMTGMA